MGTDFARGSELAPLPGTATSLVDANGNPISTGGGAIAVNLAQTGGFGANAINVPSAQAAVLQGLLTAAGIFAQTGTSSFDMLRTPTIFKQGTATSTGSTALWTPAAGKKFRLMRYMVTVPSNAVAAAQADLVISLLDAAGPIGIAHVVNIPAAAVLTAAPPLYVSPWCDLGNGILSALANNVLNINLSFALTGGQVNVLVCGTEE